MSPVSQNLGKWLSRVSCPPYLARTAAFALATIVIGLIAPTPTNAQVAFDRPGLLALADTALTPDLLSADRHVLIVRHARKISEDCNALDCPLGPAGELMVARLDTLLGEPDFDAVLSSSACRTYETVSVAGAVVQHAAAERAREMCGGGVAERSRDDAIQDVMSGDARWTIVAEHSNTTCGWVSTIAGEAALAGTRCEGGRLSSSDYGDVFWLYQQGDDWQLTVLEGAFDVSE